MCRILGIYSPRFKISALKEKAEKARDTMWRGGPDDAGVWTDKDIPLVLAHRRLSIIDPDPRAAQPMEKFGLVITYNGEIYNYREVKNELESLGYRFSTSSDTEVILAAYREWGPEALKKFRGMWAFAIWDKKNKRLFLARDRIGVKPLYYSVFGENLAFSSELKGLMSLEWLPKRISREALEQYFRYGYIPSPLSIFENVRKLKPAHYAMINLAGRTPEIEIENYWSFTEEVKNFTEKYPIFRMSTFGGEDREEQNREHEILEISENVLEESFRYRMVADVPVGIFLSGGVDSSLVTALIQKNSTEPVKTFTIGFFEKDYDEAPHAREVARILGTEHHEHYISIKEALEILHEFPEIYDEPFGDTSGIPTYLVSKIARNHVKVALSADGGDELFCGYSNYLPSVKLAKTLSRIPLPVRKLLKSLMSSPFVYNSSYRLFRALGKDKSGFTNFPGKYTKLMEVLSRNGAVEIFETTKRYFSEQELKNLLGPPESSGFVRKLLKKDQDVLTLGKNALDRMMIADAKSYLPEDILVKVDRATMWASLEGRDPFLDNEIVGLAFSIPTLFKHKNGISKYILKRILSKYIPWDLINRPKQGFGVPLIRWLRNEMKGFSEELLFSRELDSLRHHGVKINTTYLRRTWHKFQKGYPINPERLWLIISLAMWLNRWKI